MTTTTTPAAPLFAFITAARVVNQYQDNDATTDTLREIARLACDVREAGANPWPAVEAATALMWNIDWQPGPGRYDEPVGYSHWLRQAWLELVRAAAAAAGHGDDDAPRWKNMTAAELADELTYLADYQG